MDPSSLARLHEAALSLAPLSAPVVVDENQHQPNLLPLSRSPTGGSVQASSLIWSLGTWSAQATLCRRVWSILII